MYPFTPDLIYVDREVETHPRTEAILERLPNVPAELAMDVRDLKHVTDVSKAKKEWILTRHRGRAFKPCQGMPKGSGRRDVVSGLTPDFPEHCLACWERDEEIPKPGSDPQEQRDGLTPHICCCYYVMDLVSGCPMDCSYCILQSYLENNPRTQIFVNLDEILGDVDAHLKRWPATNFRIGTGELGDSLALDPVTRFSEELIHFFAKQDNATLELKTKTDFVDHILDCNHAGKTVVSWSVNAEHIVRDEERGAASLAKRLAAASRCIEAGYRVGFHFDPIIITDDGDVAGYERVVDQIFETVDSKQIAWISLGLLRLPYSMKAVAQRRFPTTRIFSGEIVPAGNKLRYPRFLRTQYYKPLWNKLMHRLPANKVYLCMETSAAWQKLDDSIANHSDLERRLTT